MHTYRLLAVGGLLYFPTGKYDDHPSKPSMLIRRYDAGDCDTCRWPFRNDKDKERLAYALYDERETNETWKTPATIELPDGTPFNFDELVK